jgi:hypothetical protein
MMSIEETGNLSQPPSPEALAAAKALAGKLAEGVRYDAAPVPETSHGAAGNATDGAPLGLAEAAREIDLSWARDAANNNNKLALVSDREDELTDADKADAINQLLSRYGFSRNDGEVTGIIDDIETIQKRSALSGALAKVESALQKIAAEKSQSASGGGAAAEKARLWGEIGKLNEEIKQDLKKLDHLKTKEEKEREKDLMEKLDKAQADLAQLEDDPNATPEQKRRAQLAWLEALEARNKEAYMTALRIFNDPRSTSEEREAAERTMRNTRQQDQYMRKFTNPQQDLAELETPKAAAETESRSKMTGKTSKSETATASAESPFAAMAKLEKHDIAAGGQQVSRSDLGALTQSTPQLPQSGKELG